MYVTYEMEAFAKPAISLPQTWHNQPFVSIQNPIRNENNLDKWGCEISLRFLMNDHGVQFTHV